jgi:hypothetical protein
MTTIAEVKQRILDQIHNTVGFSGSEANCASLANAYATLVHAERASGENHPAVASGTALIGPPFRTYKCSEHGRFLAQEDPREPYEAKCRWSETGATYCGRFALAVEATSEERALYEADEANDLSRLVLSRLAASAVPTPGGYRRDDGDGRGGTQALARI